MKYSCSSSAQTLDCSAVSVEEWRGVRLATCSRPSSTWHKHPESQRSGAQAVAASAHTPAACRKCVWQAERTTRNVCVASCSQPHNSWSRCAKGQGASSPAPAAPTPLRPAHERSTPAKQRARRQSPCTHANRSPECVPAPPNVTHSRAEPEEPRRGAGAPGRAPHLSRAARNTRNRGARLAGQFKASDTQLAPTSQQLAKVP